MNPEEEKEIKVEETIDEEIVPEDGEGAVETTEAKLKKLREELKKSTEEKGEYLAGWQRSKADFINQRNDLEKWKEDFISFANKNLIDELLPVLDSFNLAFGNKEAWEKVDKN